MEVIQRGSPLNLTLSQKLSKSYKMLQRSPLRRLNIKHNTHQSVKKYLSSKAASDFHPFFVSLSNSQSQTVHNRLHNTTENQCKETQSGENIDDNINIRISIDFIPLENGNKSPKVKEKTRELVPIEAQRSLEKKLFHNVLNYSENTLSNGSKKLQVRVSLPQETSELKEKITSSVTNYIYGAFTPKSLKDAVHGLEVSSQTINFSETKKDVYLPGVASIQDNLKTQLLKNDNDFKRSSFSQEIDPIPTPGLEFDWSEPPIFEDFKDYVGDYLELSAVEEEDEFPMNMTTFLSPIEAKPVKPLKNLADFFLPENNPAEQPFYNLEQSLQTKSITQPSEFEAMCDQKLEEFREFLEIIRNNDINFFDARKEESQKAATQFARTKQNYLTTKENERYKSSSTLYFIEKNRKISMDVPAVSKDVPNGIFSDVVNDLSAKGSHINMVQNASEPSPINMKQDNLSNTEEKIIKEPSMGLETYLPLCDHNYYPQSVKKKLSLAGSLETSLGLGCTMTLLLAAL